MCGVSEGTCGVGVRGRGVAPSAYCELSNRLERRSHSMLRADFFPGLEGKACRRQGCFRLSANGILVSAHVQ